MDESQSLIQSKNPRSPKRRDPKLKIALICLLCLVTTSFLVLRCVESVRMENSSVTVEEYEKAKVYTLTRGQIEVKITDWGATVMSLKVPDSRGQVDDIALGFDNVGTYVEANYSTYFGAIVGRVANRIANASFQLDGEVYSLHANNGPNCLHGGRIGFDRVHWESSIVDHSPNPKVQFTYNSYDGEEGFPGDLAVSVTYTLSENGEFKIYMEALPGTKATPVNLATHSYWNLRGQGSGDILGHEIQIFGGYYTPVDGDLIPTGEIASVQDTPFDFLEAHSIGSRIDEIPGGYDHNYVLTGAEEDDGLKKAARVVDPVSGRVMELSTSVPGMQFYTGNFLEGVTGKGGVDYQIHGAFCLETQGFPNAINEPKFPSVLLEPGQMYTHTMTYKFSTL